MEIDAKKLLQVADKIRRDERVSVIERTNLRYLPGLPQKVDLVTLDLSFISILLVCFKNLGRGRLLCFRILLVLFCFACKVVNFPAASYAFH